MTAALLVTGLWSLLLLILALSLHGWLPRWGAARALAARGGGAGLIVAIALAARLLPNFILPVGASYDIESYAIVADLAREGQDIYASAETEARHPYLPFQLYWMILARKAAAALGLPFVQVVRLGPIGIDALIALLLYLGLNRGEGPGRALYGGLSYALNPIPVFVSAVHGQFDAVPALFLLLSVLTVVKPAALAGGWLGLGILSKSWPVLALPGLLWGVRGWRRRLLFLLGAVAAPLAGVGAYLAWSEGSLALLLERSLGYNRGYGVWGYTYLLRMLALGWTQLGGLFTGFAGYARLLTLGFLGLFWLARVRKEAPAAGVLTILVAFLALTHAFAIQYLMWVVPFAILAGDDRWLARYTLAAFAYVLFVYSTLILSMQITRLLPWPQADWFLIMPAGLPAWATLVAWAGARLRRRTPTAASSL